MTPTSFVFGVALHVTIALGSVDAPPRVGGGFSVSRLRDARCGLGDSARPFPDRVPPLPCAR